MVNGNGSKRCGAFYIRWKDLWRKKEKLSLPERIRRIGSPLFWSKKSRACDPDAALYPCRFKGLQANADSKVAPLHSRRARLQAELGAFEYLRLETSLGVSLLCRDDKTLKPAERNLVRSRQKQEAHCFLTLQPLTGA
jgi:hypothetical protein